MNTLSNHRGRGHGFSLVEVMVAMVLGVFLILGVTQIVSVSRGLYQSNAAIARMQENGRFALSVLTRNIRMAGFTGCSPTNTVEIRLNKPATAVNPNAIYAWWENFGTSPTATPLATPDTFGISKVSGVETAGVAIMGYDGSQAFPTLGSPADVQFTPVANGKRVSGTDAVIILGGDGGYTVTAIDKTLSKLMAKSLTKPSGVTLAAGDLLIACDATSGTTNATLFQVTSVIVAAVGGTNSTIYHVAAGTPGNSASDLGVENANTPFDKITLRDYIPTAFYIGTSGSGGVTNSLYQLQFSNSSGSMVSQELAEGVQDMQILYGEDTLHAVTDPAYGAVDVYHDAGSVANWSNVMAVRISLLMVTLEDGVVPQPQSYVFPADTGDARNFGRTGTGSDRRFHQVFSATVGLRNRLRSP